MRVHSERSDRPGWGRRRAATAVEFALILPVLLTLILACVDFGRFPHTHIAVTNAARAGAGYGSQNPTTAATVLIWKAQVRQAVEEEMNSLNGFDPARLSVVVADPVVESDGMWRVRVEVSYPFETAVRWPGIPAQVTLRQVVVMRGIR